MKKQLRFFLVTFFAVPALACQAIAIAPTATPVPTVTPTPTPIPTPTIYPTPIPIPVLLPGLEGVKLDTLCIERKFSYSAVGDSFGDQSDDQTQTQSWLNENDDELIGFIEYSNFNWMGIKVGTRCDATLTIVVDAHSGGALYKTPLYKFCYSGFRIEVQLTLDVPGYDPIVADSFFEREAPQIINFCDEKPQDLRTAVIGSIEDGLAKIWGSWILVQHLSSSDAQDELEKMGDRSIPAILRCLQCDDLTICEPCIWYVGEMEAPAALEAVPYLIRILAEQKDDDDLRAATVRALESITGINFGEDVDQWQQWWDSQQK